MINFASYNGGNWPYTFQNGIAFVDAKPILKFLFSSGANFINEVPSKLPAEAVINEGGRSPLWVEVNAFQGYLATKQNATCNPAHPDASEFNFAVLRDLIFDALYDLGHLSFVSDRRAKDLAAEKERANTAAAKRLSELEIENARLKNENAARIENEKERARAGVNPVIRALNNVWFPVLMSAVFALVIGGFSYEILSQTMGLNLSLNVALSIAWVMFPVLTAIRQYEFDLFGTKIQPLWIVMVVDMVFTAYHVGWLREEGTLDTSTAIELHWLLKCVYITIIPLMQKGVNDMLLRIRATYLVKGWLPKVD